MCVYKLSDELPGRCGVINRALCNRTFCTLVWSVLRPLQVPRIRGRPCMLLPAGGRSHFVVRIRQLLLMAREQFILQLVIYTALARMPWPRLGEGGDRGINVPALPRCLGRRQNKEAIVRRPTLSQRNPEPFQSQFALTMSSLFRDLYSIEADMSFTES